MSKTMKNLLRGFTLICIIVLVVFSVELLILNREASGGEETAPPTENNTPTGTKKPVGTQPSSTLTSNNPSPGESESPQPSAPPAPKGKRYELQVLAAAEKEKLVVYAEEEKFEYSMGDYGYEFKYKGDEKARLEITPLVMPRGAAKEAESVLDGYLDGGESNVGVPGKIRRSSLNGVFVSGLKGGVTYEAWLYGKDENSTEGILFVIQYENDAQKNALHAILDSLDIIKT